jgi:toxin ParE1/3/4
MTRSMPVRLTAGAQQDVTALSRYLRDRHGPLASKAFRNHLIEAVARLRQFPHRGVVPRELEAIGVTDYRQILSGPNRIIYRVMDDAVIVFIVVDGRRDLQSLLERRMLIG